MPNWVKHEITFTGSKEDLDKLESLAKEDTFFHNLIPIPEDLYIDAGSAEFTAKNERFIFIKSADEQIDSMRESYKNGDEPNVDNFVKSIRNYIVHGYTSWYPFCINKWGSKWDACELLTDRTNDETLFMVFDTAWNTVEPVFKKIAQTYPDVVFTGEFADEDVGSNCGRINGAYGKAEVTYLENGSDDAIAFAKEVLGIWEEGEE